jgi:hypothetical protein
MKPMQVDLFIYLWLCNIFWLVSDKLLKSNKRSPIRTRRLTLEKHCSPKKKVTTPTKKTVSSSKRTIAQILTQLPRRWLNFTSAQICAMQNYFQQYIERGDLPQMRVCETFLQESSSLFQGDVYNWVQCQRNKYRSLKKFDWLAPHFVIFYVVVVLLSLFHLLSANVKFCNGQTFWESFNY